ncbi:Jag1p [Dermatophagoides pteronyssinus]|uniref:Delta-like protein n=1 Tax=Dermatophagoides pteronyssinus TaxID=6956 RepID=A0ABQ8JQ97_DERPT|nr:Jag1p [Dermatophagoides pteronyssinus]
MIIIITITTTSVINPVHASGYFELQFIEGIRNSTTIHVCLKEFWNSQINLNRCTFGQKTLTILYYDYQHYHIESNLAISTSSSSSSATTTTGITNNNNNKQSMIRIPFSFRWIGSFSFTIQLADNNQWSSSSSSSLSTMDRFIVEDEFAIPGKHWKYRTFHASDGRIISIRFRIDCDHYYHSDDCATFCRERNDTFGHYSCESKNGHKQCLYGWKGENCDKPKCRNGCNEMHGFCELPDECQCRSGWRGKNCNECVPYPGCLHGYCVSPFQCICKQNWGGILCDQDLNYCGTHEPCLNDGRCENIAPDNYRCVCKKGFSGVNCQIVEDACATTPCLHDGTCITLTNGTDFQCVCRPGFFGKRCENDLNECSTQPCLNGATCHDLENNYRCTCPNGWTGNRCELDVDECSALLTPCIHSNACININGSYICVCKKGFEGLFCENEIDDCKHNQIQCQNGGFCIDLINDFRCVCSTGFTGARCDRIDESVCESIPNHVWYLNETDCEKICLCRENFQVDCKCQQREEQEQESTNNQCNNLKSKRTNLSEIRIIFDSNVDPKQTCTTIQSIHSLLTIDSNLDDDHSDNGNNEFCCQLRITDNNDDTTSTTGNEIIIKVNKQSKLAQYISRTLFPHILHVIVNMENIRQSDWTFVNLLLILIFTTIAVSGILSIKSYYRRRKHESDAENVVIHCIQNNLKISRQSPSPTMNIIRPPSSTTNQKLCNTFGGNNHHQQQQTIDTFHRTKILPQSYCTKLTDLPVINNNNKLKMID